MKKQLVCPNCGSSEDVVIRYQHIGGQGEAPIIQCQNEVQCWKRWDEKKLRRE